MVNLDPGMPRKVLRWAQEHGVVHSDCLVASNPCQACTTTIMAAFDHFYGQQTSVAEVISAIIDDFRRDQIDDERGEP